MITLYITIFSITYTMWLNLRVTFINVIGMNVGIIVFIALCQNDLCLICNGTIKGNLPEVIRTFQL